MYGYGFGYLFDTLRFSPPLAETAAILDGIGPWLANMGGILQSDCLEVVNAINKEVIQPTELLGITLSDSMVI